MDIKLNLTEKEARFLQIFAKKQYEGATDNVGTRTPIHVVERKETTFVSDNEGDTFEWCGADGLSIPKYYSSLNDITNCHNAETGDSVPYYDDGELSDYYNASEYFEYYGINACTGTIVESYRPVAFFFILDEAKRYKDDYQKHNCADCRIYTYGLGYSNNGDMPVFRELLMKMGTALLPQSEPANDSVPYTPVSIKETLEQYRAMWEAIGGTLYVDEETFDPARLDCLWYDGEIAYVEYNGFEISIRVNGEVNAFHRRYDGDDIIFAEGTGETFRETFEGTFASDAELDKALDDATLSLEANNWIEYYFYDEDGEELNGLEAVSSAENVLEALTPESILPSLPQQ